MELAITGTIYSNIPFVAMAINDIIFSSVPTVITHTVYPSVPMARELWYLKILRV